MTVLCELEYVFQGILQDIFALNTSPFTSAQVLETLSQQERTYLMSAVCEVSGSQLLPPSPSPPPPEIIQSGAAIFYIVF